METTATLDKTTDEFIINTPSVAAQKYWITNGALHAHYCCVFARIINGEEDEGLHVILVPIRDKEKGWKYEKKQFRWTFFMSLFSMNFFYEPFFDELFLRTFFDELFLWTFFRWNVLWTFFPWTFYEPFSIYFFMNLFRWSFLWTFFGELFVALCNASLLSPTRFFYILFLCQF